MKSKDQVTKELGKLKEEEIRLIQGISMDLTNLLNNKTLTEDTLHTLYNAITGLSTLKENLTIKLVRLLKQDHMLD